MADFINKGIIAALVFIVDMMSLIQDTGQQIDWGALDNRWRRGAFPISVNGAVLAAATSVVVDPLLYPLRKGDSVHLGGGKTFTVAADYDAGETNLTTYAVPAAIADNAVGYGVQFGYENSGFFIPAGTILCRISATKKMVPRVSRLGAETAECILLTNAKSESKTDSETGYGVTYGGMIYENMLPDAVVATGLIDNTIKTELGARFVWKVSRDNRGS